MVSYCLFNQLTGAPTIGGTWTFTSSTGGSVQVGTVCPTVMGACTGSLMTKNVGQTLGTDKPCVTISMAGEYKFTYTVSGPCCNPCSAIITITVSELDLALAVAGPTDCSETWTITNKTSSVKTSTPAGNNCDERTLNASITLTKTSSCGGVIINNTIVDSHGGVNNCAGRTANGYVIDLNSANFDGCECCPIKYIDTHFQNGGVVAAAQLDMTQSFTCPGFCTIGTDAQIKAYYECAIPLAITAATGGTITASDYELIVTVVSKVVTIQFVNKNVYWSNSKKWLGVNPSDKLGASTVSNASCCNEPANLLIPSQPFEINNDAIFTGTVAGGSCQLGGANVSMTFTNITKIDFPNTPEFNKLQANPTSSWVYDPGSKGIQGWSVSTPGSAWTKTCKIFQLTASSGCVGVNYLWSTGAVGPLIQYPVPIGGSPECVSVKATCGACSKCMHINLSSSVPYILGPWTGDCSCGNMNCATCT